MLVSIILRSFLELKELRPLLKKNYSPTLPLQPFI